MTEYTKKIEAVDSMSDTNLFITMLNGVTNGRLTETEAYDMARKMIKYSSFFTRIDTASVSEFMDFGLEEHEAVALVSMAEILRRSLVRKAERETIFSSESLGNRLIAQIGCREQEHLMAFYLDTQNKVIDERVISIGSNKRSLHHLLTFFVMQFDVMLRLSLLLIIILLERLGRVTRIESSLEPSLMLLNSLR